MSVKNFAKKAVYAFLTIGAGLGLLGSSEVKGQSTLNLKQTVEADTLWGYGVYQAINAQTSNFIPGVTITSYAIAMDMVIDPTRREEVTDNNGAAPFEKYPVYIDSTVSISELLKQNSQIVPTIGSEINAFFSEQLSGTIELYDLNGNLVEKQKFNSDHAYVNLSRLATGMHIYKIKTSQGIEFSDKFMKSGDRINGPANRPSIGLKGSRYIEEATYTVVWEKEGSIIKDSTNITLYEGNNGFINLFIQPIPGIPQHQDFTGTVRDGDNNYAPLAGALITVEDVITGDTLWRVSDNDGKFTFENMGTGKEYRFSVGNLSGKQSHHNSTYFTPLEITQASDTIANHFDAVLKNLNGLSTQHIKDHTLNGSQQGVIQYYLGDSYNETQKAWLRNSFTQFQADENNVHKFAESSTQLNDTGINIEAGTYNTQTDEEAIITPFGTLYRVISATTTMGTGNYIGFVHEIKRALGIDGVSWPSVMKTPATVYHQEDKNIGMFEGQYWKDVYDGMTNIDLNTITETIPIPAAARAFKENDYKGKFNNYNKNIPSSKMSVFAREARPKPA